MFASAAVEPRRADGSDAGGPVAVAGRAVASAGARTAGGALLADAAAAVDRGAAKLVDAGAAGRDVPAAEAAGTDVGDASPDRAVGVGRAEPTADARLADIPAAVEGGAGEFVHARAAGRDLPAAEEGGADIGDAAPRRAVGVGAAGLAADARLADAIAAVERGATELAHAGAAGGNLPAAEAARGTLRTGIFAAGADRAVGVGGAEPAADARLANVVRAVEGGAAELVNAAAAGGA